MSKKKWALSVALIAVAAAVTTAVIVQARRRAEDTELANELAAFDAFAPPSESPADLDPETQIATQLEAELASKN